MNLKEYRHLESEGLWTKAFTAAMNALTSQGGGTLTVPAGHYKTAPIELRSNITLQVEAGAEIEFSDDKALFPLVDTEFEGIPSHAYMPCVFARDAHNVRIEGTGTLNGSGEAWWRQLREGTLDYPRPYLVCFQNCRDVSLQGVTLINSPCWTVHPLYCDHVDISHLIIRNPANSPNTDGIDPDGCTNVRIADCLIDVGDDCIAIKAGTEDTPVKHACKNIIISGCHMLHGHGGVVIGSEMSGGVKNVIVTNCVFQGTDRGVRIKTRRGRGGSAENLLFSHIIMEDVLCPFVCNMYYFCGKDGKTPLVRDKQSQPISDATPEISDITFADVTVHAATASAGFLYGLPESPIRRVRIRDCTIVLQTGHAGCAAMMDELEPTEAAGLYLRNVEDIKLIGLRIIDCNGKEMDDDRSVHYR